MNSSWKIKEKYLGLEGKHLPRADVYCSPMIISESRSNVLKFQG